MSAVCSFLLTISSVSAKYSAYGEELADGGFAGVGAFLGKVDILRADQDVGALGGGNHGGQENG